MRRPEILVSTLMVVLFVHADIRETFMLDYVKGSDFFRMMDSTDKLYGASAFFFDFNGDGEEEAIVSRYIDEDPMGDRWAPVCRNRMGEVRTGKFRETAQSEAILRVFAWARLFYRADLTLGVRSFLGRQIDVAEYVPVESRILREKSSRRKDVMLAMDAQGDIVIHDLPHEIDDIVGNPGFEKLERARWENYHGREMKRVPQGDGWFGFKPIPTEQLRPLGGIAQPPEFDDAFVKRYREEVKSRLNVTNDVAVLAVFHDADNDGDVDAYVSSSAERTGSDHYRWHLYLNNGKGAFIRATRRFWKRADEFDDAVYIEPEVAAARTAFHRLVRFGRPPALVVLEKVGNRVHTHGFLKYLTEEERRNQPHVGSALHDKEKGRAYHEWGYEVNNRLGHVRPFDMRELVDDLSFFRLERLPCKAFPAGGGRAQR